MPQLSGRGGIGSTAVELYLTLGTGSIPCYSTTARYEAKERNTIPARARHLIRDRTQRYSDSGNGNRRPEPHQDVSSAELAMEDGAQ